MKTFYLSLVLGLCLSLGCGTDTNVTTNTGDSDAAEETSSSSPAESDTEGSMNDLGDAEVASSGHEDGLASAGDDDVLERGAGEDGLEPGPDTTAPEDVSGPQDVTITEGVETDAMEPDPTPTALTLTHLGTTEMEQGTHRPEIFTLADGDLLLAVVHPSGNSKEEGGIKHQAYRLDANLAVKGQSFVLTTTTELYGEPADHRVLIVDDELVVVYQTLLFGDDMPLQPGGPAEDYAESQSLMLARFNLDGTELFRGPIVAHSTDFSEDNFPDHCMVWSGESLLVSTGTSGNQVKFRVVTLEGEVLETFVSETTSDTIGGTIGNSLFHHQDSLFLVSGQHVPATAPKGLVFAELDENYAPSPVAKYVWDGEDPTFPTGTLVHQGLLFIAFSGHEAGSSPDIQVNPYSPRLAVFDDAFNPLAEELVSTEAGSGHVHPTVAAIGDTLFYAWSRKLENNGNVSTPQVLIESYGLDAQ
jgi:hypothetical protein